MDFLIAISLRSTAIATGAWILLLVARVKSPAARHAVWTLVTLGMLSIAIAGATLPTVPVPVLRAVSPQPVVTVRPAILPSGHLPPPPRPFPWTIVYAAGVAISAGRLAYGWILTQRLVRGAGRLPEFDDGVFESTRIAVPLTIAGKILLPAGWRCWTPEKLEAVLVHERTHVRRFDWAIAALTALNRSIYWFHPLAWWLERHLHILAEQACDDASLTRVAPESYAEVLLEMAAAVRSAKHRVAWEAAAMAKGAEVRMRIERILDDNRPLFRPVTRARYAATAVAALPIILIAALARPAHIVLAQEPPRPAPPPAVPVERTAPSQTNFAVAGANFEIARLLQEKLELESQLSNYLNRLAYYQAQAAGSSTFEELTHHIQELRSQLAAAHELYTDSAPQVKRIQAALAALEKARDDESADPAARKLVQDLQSSIALLQAQIQGVNLSLQKNAEQLQEFQHGLVRVTSPRLISRREPEYTPEARQSRLEGKVELTLTVGTDGVPSDIQVSRGLGSGLDEKATDCVKSWRFQPATQNGRPIPAVILVEVPFRL
jgi:TonB family protein